MRVWMTAAAAALAMATAGCVGAPLPEEREGSALSRMKDACRIAAEQELDTTQGLLTFAGDPVRQPDGKYELNGKAEGARNDITDFTCYFNEKGRYYAVKPR